MKRLLVIGLALGLTTGVYAAQDKLEGTEANVQITQQPQVTNISGGSATLTWQTSGTGANNVLYREVGSGQWKHAFNAQGSKDHSVQLTGLQPGKKYEYQILTTSNKVRAAGQFDTSVSGTSAANTTSALPQGSDGAQASGGMVPNTSAVSSQHGRVTLYRAVNSTTGAHTFTSSQSDVPSGFQVQGVAGYLTGKQAPSTAPLYGLSHPNGDYFYTTDANEKAQAAQQGWQDKGTIGYIATNQQTGTVPMYRMDGPKGLHFYTSDPNERAQASSQGWKDVGIVGYIWSK